VFYWIDGPLGYALVAEMDRGPLLQAAETVYRQVNP
jgi:anti-sigma factor RsiW